jgi:hypothetical protein
MNIEPNDDDVLRMESWLNPVKTRTVTISQVTTAFKLQIQSSFSSSQVSTADAWLEDGVECQFLSASVGQGWKKGKVRLRLEFIPDEPELPDSSALVLSPNSDPQ